MGDSGWPSVLVPSPASRILGAKDEIAPVGVSSLATAEGAGRC